MDSTDHQVHRPTRVDGIKAAPRHIVILKNAIAARRHAATCRAIGAGDDFAGLQVRGVPVGCVLVRADGPGSASLQVVKWHGRLVVEFVQLPSGVGGFSGRARREVVPSSQRDQAVKPFVRVGGREVQKANIPRSQLKRFERGPFRQVRRGLEDCERVRRSREFEF